LADAGFFGVVGVDFWTSIKMLWPRYRAGDLQERALETAAFTVFLYSRMLG
jgi:hypothetical protein